MIACDEGIDYYYCTDCGETVSKESILLNKFEHICRV